MSDLPFRLIVRNDKPGDRREVIRALARVIISADRRRREREGATIPKDTTVADGRPKP